MHRKLPDFIHVIIALETDLLPKISMVVNTGWIVIK